MPTDLFVATAGLDPAEVAAAIPPSCRRPHAPAPPAARDGAAAVVGLGPWAPRAAAVHLLPSFSPLRAADVAFRFEVSARAGGAWSPWVATATVGPAAFPPLPASTPLLASDVDVVTAATPVEAVRLRLRVTPPRALERPWLAALSAFDGRRAPVGRVDGGARLDVPALSQMEAEPAIARRVCSPACVAMVLGYWGRPAPVDTLAGEVFHRALDVYGVWPAAIGAAARRGVAGYLLRFPDWAAAAWCLGRGLPVIASVRYAAGELTGAAIAATSGHLVVLTGWDGDAVLVNDPAAPDAAAVPRRYRRDELARVWLERTGVGYVLFRAAWATMPGDA